MGVQTPLYAKHIEYKGRMVEFAGHDLPVQYEGIIAEHVAVRTKAGIFDVSHMTEFMLTGRDALANLNRILTNSFDTLKPGRVRYSPMCYDNGGTVDDLLVYCFAPNRYLIVGNACNHEKDFKHLCDHIIGDVEIRDYSERIAQLALQGPLATEVLQQLCEHELPKVYYSFVEKMKIGTVECLVSKTGYTGEDGYELYCEATDAVKLFDMLIANPNVSPCGLGARDTLRFEASMPLYGHELSADITPLECGLGFAVKMDKESFIGRKGLGNPTNRFRVGLQLTGRGIARGEEKVMLGDKEVGFVTSGTHSPTLGGAYAMAIVDTDAEEYDIVIRGKNVAAKKVAMPFYSKK